MKDNERKYTFGSALRVACRRKRGAGALGIWLLTVALALCLGLLGPIFGNLLVARDTYSENLFYVYATEETLGLLRDRADTAENGIDHMMLRASLQGYSSLGYDMLYLYDPAAPQELLWAIGTYLPRAAAGELPVVFGKGEGLSDNEILITTAMADELLRHASNGKINRRRELLGLSVSLQDGGDTHLTVAGIVRDSEKCVFLSEAALAEMLFTYTNIYAASEVGYPLAAGEALLLADGSIYDAVPQENATAMLGKKTVQLKTVIDVDGTYSAWIAKKGIQKTEERAFFGAILEEQGIEITAKEYRLAYDRIRDERYYEYIENTYSEIDAYLGEMMSVYLNIDLWLLHEKGMTDIKYLYMPYVGREFYAAVKYKEQHGTYPARSALIADEAALSALTEVAEGLHTQYAAEYEATPYARRAAALTQTGKSLVLSDADYAAVMQDVKVGERVSVELWISGTHSYIQLHSVAPERTEQYLRELLADVTIPASVAEYYPLLRTADDAVAQAASVEAVYIVLLISASAALLISVSLCMYFVMRRRARLLAEEGSESFALRYLADVVVYWLCAVFAGFFFVALFVNLVHLPFAWWSMISYPWWYLLAVLQVLLVLPLFCGSIPLFCTRRRGEDETSTPTPPAPAGTEGEITEAEETEVETTEVEVIQAEAPPKKEQIKRRRRRLLIAAIAALCLVLLLSVAGVRYRVLNALWPDAPFGVFSDVLFGVPYWQADEDVVTSNAFPAVPDTVLVYQEGRSARLSAGNAAQMHQLFTEITEDSRSWEYTAGGYANTVKTMMAEGTCITFRYDHRQKFEAGSLEPDHYFPPRTEEYHNGEEYDTLLFILTASGRLLLIKSLDGVNEYKIVDCEWSLADLEVDYFERCVTHELKAHRLACGSLLAWGAVFAFALACALVPTIRCGILLRLKRYRERSVRILSVILLLVLLGGAVANLAYYVRYAEAPVRTEVFLERPDAITVYYNEDGNACKKKLSDEEIDQVLEALETLLAQCEGSNRWQLTSDEINAWTEKEFLETRAALGAIEFHYNKRRDLQIDLFSAQSANDTDPQPYYNFYGVCDSVTLGYLDERELNVVGCLNGEYYGNAIAITLDRSAAKTFWEVIRSCI